jgi:hypothetical protein
VLLLLFYRAAKIRKRWALSLTAVANPVSRLLNGIIQKIKQLQPLSRLQTIDRAVAAIPDSGC